MTRSAIYFGLYATMLASLANGKPALMIASGLLCLISAPALHRQHAPFRQRRN